MSHQVETMAYAGEIPWHGLGTYVGDRDVNSEQMIKAAKLDWEIAVAKVESVKLPILDKNGQRTGWTVPTVVESNGQRVIVRRDDGLVLGSCKDTYTPVQNAQRFAFLDSLVADGTLRYHTAGSLFRGKMVWALVQTKDRFTIKRRNGKDDAHETYLLYNGGNDGGTPEILTPTDTRVVCDNTRRIALANGTVMQWRVKHTASVHDKLDVVRDALLGIEKANAEQQQMLQALENERMDRREFVRFAMTLLLSEKEDLDEARAEAEEKQRALRQAGSEKRSENVVADLLACFENGIGNGGATKYDAVNAVTEWIDHQRSRAAKGRQTVEQLSRAAESAWSGTGAKRKDRALRMLTRW